MTRMLLAALALACVASPAMAISLGRATLPGTAPFDWRILVAGLVAAAVVVLLVAYAARRSTLPRVRDWCVVVGFVVAVGFAFPGLAAEIAVVPTSAVVLPWGDIIVAIAQPLFSILSAVIAGLVVALIARFAPWLSTWVTRTQIEGTLGRLQEYGLNATRGAAKGKTLSVEVGSEALAKAVQYGANSATPLVIKAAGGLPGLAEKLFRKMNLDAEASAGNVLAPVLEKIGSGEIRKGA